MLDHLTLSLLVSRDNVFCLSHSSLSVIAVLIDAIVKNGSSASPGADHVPPPPGWRDEDIGRSETFNTSSDEKKTYSEEQRQGVSRCTTFTLFHHNRLTVCALNM